MDKAATRAFSSNKNLVRMRRPGGPISSSPAAKAKAKSKARARAHGRERPKMTRRQEPSSTLYRTNRTLSLASESLGPDEPTTAVLVALEQQHAELTRAGKLKAFGGKLSPPKRRALHRVQTSLNRAEAVYAGGDGSTGTGPRTSRTASRTTSQSKNSPGKTAYERKKKLMASRPKGPYHQSNLKSPAKGPTPVRK